MSHPGPPRFTSVGQTIELAPRDIDPSADYEWRLSTAPSKSDLSVADAPVTQVVPDEPGTYEFELRGPNGTHTQTARVFPDERRPARFELPFDELESPEDVETMAIEGVSFDFDYDYKEATLVEDKYVYETEMLPGRRRCVFIENGDKEAQDNVTFLNATVSGPSRPTISLDVDVRSNEVVITADAASPNPGRGDDELEIEFHCDDRDDLTLNDLSIDDGRVRVSRSAIRGTVRLHAVAVGERHSIADSVRLEESGDGVDVSKPTEPPEWAKNPTFYEIFVRSFVGEGSKSKFIDLERRVPYLDSLGIDCVWLTPILQNDGHMNHGYNITNYFETAEDLGTLDEFKSFVDECHKHDIKVLFDIVINHTASSHPHFEQFEAGVPAYRDWYFDGDERPQYCFHWHQTANLNYDSPAVRRFILDLIDTWAPIVDGFRCDAPFRTPHGFWKELSSRARSHDDDFLLLSEGLPPQPEYHEAGLQMHYDYRMHTTLREIHSDDVSATQILDDLEYWGNAGFPEESTFLRYLESHDVERYIDVTDRSTLKAAAAAVFFLPGAPMIYYGQERGMTESRGQMNWDTGDDELTEFHRSISALRNDHSALSEGTVERVEWSAESDDVVAFARRGEDEEILVALNFGEEPNAVCIDRATDPTDLITEESVGEEVDGSTEIIVEDAVAVRAARTGTDGR